MQPRSFVASDREWQDGEEFHRKSLDVYTGDATLRALFKRADDMAHVRYAPSHPNPSFEDFRGGRGSAYCVWLASEQDGQAEGVSRSAMDGLLDTWLEPRASVGWHTHRDTEEICYVLEGELEVRTEDGSGTVHTFGARSGDTSRVGPGMSHAARAGDNGARFLCIISKVVQGPRS